MIIQRDSQWVFLGPPKCATTTMHQELVLPPWNGQYAVQWQQHDMTIPAECLDYFTFATVRDPYERAMSLYWHYLRDVRRYRGQQAGLPPDEARRAMELPTADYMLEDFLDMATAGYMSEIAQPDGHFFTHIISDYLRDVRVDATLRVEWLEDDFERLPFVSDHVSDFRVVNAPGRGKWATHRTAQAVKLIGEWAAEDFERYGYAHQDIEA